MARSTRLKPPVAFQYPARVEVRRPRFHRSAALAYVDAGKLSRAARAEFEVGYLESECCRTPIMAVVRSGMVTALRVEACAECKPVRLTPELEAMLKSARRRIGVSDRPFRPLTVAQFMRGVAETIIVGPCQETCITIGGYGVCFFCCGIGSERWCSIRIVVPKEARAS
jgi:hypothetical protein